MVLQKKKLRHQATPNHGFPLKNGPVMDTNFEIPWHLSSQSPVTHGFPAMLSGLGRVIHVGANGRKESLRGSAEAWPGPCLGGFWALLRSSRIELLRDYLSY